MGTEKRELGEELTPEEMLDIMTSESVIGKNRKPSKAKWLKNLLTNKIPLLQGFLRSSNGSFIASSNFARVQGELPQAIQGAIPALRFANLGTAAIDLFRIPAIYLMAFISGEKPPLTLYEPARWLYSAALVGVTLTAILLPAVAPPLALAGAGLTLGFSLFAMGNLLYQRYYAIPKRLREVENQISVLQNELDTMREVARDFGDELKLYQQDTEEYQELAQTIKTNYNEYEEKVTRLQALEDEKTGLQEARKAMGPGQFLTRGVPIVLASLMIVGLVAALFVPPVGLGIVAGVTGFGALFAIARIGYALLAPLFNKGNEKPVLEKEEDVEEEEPLSHESTLDITENLVSAAQLKDSLISQAQGGYQEPQDQEPDNLKDRLRQVVPTQYADPNDEEDDDDEGPNLKKG